MTTTLSAETAPTATRPVVAMSGVGKSFGRGSAAVTALTGVDLRVDPGEFVCLLGASGCGKSTLLNLVAGLDQPSSGTIDLHSARPAVMFQEAALMPWLTAAGNVELALRLAGVRKAARRARTDELLDLVRLSGLGRKRPHELSGGMRQRVALARALAGAVQQADVTRPPLLLMDEPFSALDAITRDVLQAELLRVWSATGSAVLFVTHDVREAVRLGQRVVLLSSRPGRVLREWRPAEASDAETIAEINEHLREVISRHARH